MRGRGEERVRRGEEMVRRGEERVRRGEDMMRQGEGDVDCKTDTIELVQMFSRWPTVVASCTAVKIQNPDR